MSRGHKLKQNTCSNKTHQVLKAQLEETGLKLKAAKVQYAQLEAAHCKTKSELHKSKLLHLAELDGKAKQLKETQKQLKHERFCKNILAAMLILSVVVKGLSYVFS